MSDIQMSIDVVIDDDLETYSATSESIQDEPTIIGLSIDDSIEAVEIIDESTGERKLLVEMTIDDRLEELSLFDAESDPDKMTIEINPGLEDIDLNEIEKSIIFKTKISSDENNVISSGSDGGVFLSDIQDPLAYYILAKS